LSGSGDAVVDVGEGDKGGEVAVLREETRERRARWRELE
jgi:hypothetical protein